MTPISITWKGQTLQFLPKHRLYRTIEAEVPFLRVANAIEKASMGKAEASDIPMSHVAFVIFCCLQHAGAAVSDEMEVQKALLNPASGELPDYGQALRQLTNAYFSVGSEVPPKKDPAAPAQPAPTPSTPSEKTSASDTASQ